MIGLTLCSGIGAPEMAAPWVDWRFASEIEPFPREVLRQRLGYQLPEDHNQGEPLLWGDMTEVTPELLRARGIPLPDLIVAGTPCQAFSIAGAREGLENARLQGFPDLHTRIPWRGKPAEECPDSNQYKALGNSMAVPCIKWILDRLRVSWDEHRA